MRNKINFNDAQQSVISSQAESLVVSASAGSGKTTVMIERIVKLIEDGKTDLENILVLTFTNASAADMKEKLYNKLTESAKYNKNSQKAILALPLSDISTIDAFCQKLVKTFFYLINVDPEFSIISQIEESLLKDKLALDLISKEILKNSLEMQKLLDLYFEKRNLNTIKNLIFNILNRLNVTTNKENFINKIASGCYNINFFDNVAAEDFLKSAKLKLSAISEKAVTLQMLFKERQETNIDNFLSNVNINLLSLKNTTDFESFVKTLFTLSDFKSPTGKQFSDSEKASVKNYITPFLTEVRKVIAGFKNDIGAADINEIEKLMESNRLVSNYLLNLALNLQESYIKEKSEKALLDFADIENYAEKLLTMAEVKDKIQEKYRFIFADEYQDVNELQDGILKNTQIKNDFIVGDAKQSIYEFRLANPQIFIDKIKASGEKKKTDKVLLNSNYRSKAKILSFVNFVFDTIMTDETSGISYKDLGHFQFDEEKTDEPETNPVKVFLIDNKETEEVPEKTFDEVYSVINETHKQESNTAAKTEAMLVYKEIKALQKAGVAFKDISLLVRSKNENVKTIIKFLKQKDIKVSINFKTNLLEESEVLYLHNYLKLISNRFEDSNLVSVMLSPFYSFSYTELMQIRKKYLNEKFFYDAVFKYASEQSDDTALKIKKLIYDLNGFTLDLTKTNLSGLAEKIVLDLNYYEKLNFVIDADRDLVEKYLSLLKSFDSYSLTYFIALTKNGFMQSNEEANSINSDSIKINTIHSSKGLEYDYVFLLDAGKQFNFASLKEPIIISNKYGLALKSFNADSDEFVKNIVYTVAANEKKFKMQAEEIRLLYVALTRAKNGLFIFGKADISKLTSFKETEDVLKAKTYLAFILGSLNTDNINKLMLQKNISQNYADFSVVNTKEIDDEITNLFKVKILPQASEADKEKVKKLINAGYDSASYSVKFKNSVSGLLNNNNLNAELYTPKEETEEETEVNSAVFNKTDSLVGTTYHKILEMYNFNNENYAIEINRVFEKLSAAEESIVEKSVIEKIVTDKNLMEILNSGKVYKEQKFILKCKANEILDTKCDDEILVQGIIDVLVKTEDGFIIIDYKATHKSDAAVLEAYSAQLKLYKQAAEKILQICCKNLFVYNIFSGKIIEVR